MCTDIFGMYALDKPYGTDKKTDSVQENGDNQFIFFNISPVCDTPGFEFFSLDAGRK